jgi:general secretion pathway protein D
VSVLGGLVQHTTTKSVSGWPGFEKIPFLRYFFTQENTQQQNDEVLIVLTPHVVRMPNITAEDLASLFTGTGEHVTVQQQPVAAEESSAGVPVIPPPSSSASSAASASTVPVPPAQAKPGTEPALAFEPASVSLPPGSTTTIALVVRNAADLYSVPMILRYDPKVIAVEDVRNGGFLSGGSQPIAIFHHEDTKLGQSIISVMRPPNVSGVNGNGTLVGVVVKALAPGNSTLTIAQVGAKNSAGKPIDFSTGTATIHVGSPK